MGLLQRENMLDPVSFRDELLGGDVLLFRPQAWPKKAGGLGF